MYAHIPKFNLLSSAMLHVCVLLICIFLGLFGIEQAIEVFPQVLDVSLVNC